MVSQYLVGIQRSLDIGTVFHIPTHKLKPHFQPSLKTAPVRATQHYLHTHKVYPDQAQREGFKKEAELLGADRLRKRKAQAQGRAPSAQPSSAGAVTPLTSLHQAQWWGERAS